MWHLRLIINVVIKFGGLPFFACIYFCPNPTKYEITGYILYKPILNQMHSRDPTSSYIVIEYESYYENSILEFFVHSLVIHSCVMACLSWVGWKSEST